MEIYPSFVRSTEIWLRQKYPFPSRKDIEIATWRKLPFLLNNSHITVRFVLKRLRPFSAQSRELWSSVAAVSHNVSSKKKVLQISFIPTNVLSFPITPSEQTGGTELFFLTPRSSNGIGSTFSGPNGL